jgi:adenosylcobinamide kinase/adenosylcobinamide-phosphate guanylyltransferase
VRSGKSRLAERLARDSGLPVLYVATGQAGDEEMARRIAGHRERRPAEWALIEEPLALADVLARECDPGRCVLVDCLTLWLTNCLMAAGPLGAASGPAPPPEERIAALLGVVASAPGRLILVGNETGLGVVPMGELSRRFCDLAGVLHQDLAARCDQVILTVAGLPLLLKGCLS